jgi:hypothetical protein
VAYWGRKWLAQQIQFVKTSSGYLFTNNYKHISCLKYSPNVISSLRYNFPNLMGLNCYKSSQNTSHHETTRAFVCFPVPNQTMP